MEYQLQDKKLAIKKKYDLKYDELKLQSKETEKDAINDFNDGNISNEELSNKILNIRENLESDKEKILRDKVKETKKLEGEHEQRMKDFAQEYDLDPYIKVGLSSSKTGYEAVLRE